jgi:hypothetical protein
MLLAGFMNLLDVSIVNIAIRRSCAGRTPATPDAVTTPGRPPSESAAEHPSPLRGESSP